MVMEISLIILSLAFLVLVAFTIPSLIQVWRTAKKASETLEIINRTLPDILNNVERLTANINQATSVLQSQIDGWAVLSQRVQGIAGIFLNVEQVLRGRMKVPLFQAISSISAVGKGVTAFLKVYRAGR